MRNVFQLNSTDPKPDVRRIAKHKLQSKMLNPIVSMPLVVTIYYLMCSKSILLKLYRFFVVIKREASGDCSLSKSPHFQ